MTAQSVVSSQSIHLRRKTKTPEDSFPPKIPNSWFTSTKRCYTITSLKSTCLLLLATSPARTLPSLSRASSPAQSTTISSRISSSKLPLRPVLSAQPVRSSSMIPPNLLSPFAMKRDCPSGVNETPPAGPKKSNVCFDSHVCALMMLMKSSASAATRTRWPEPMGEKWRERGTLS